jgi:hypothetical protein
MSEKTISRYSPFNVDPRRRTKKASERFSILKVSVPLNEFSLCCDALVTRRKHRGGEKRLRCLKKLYISMDQLGNRRRGVRAEPLTTASSGQIFKDDVNGFSSTSDIFL